MTIDIALTNPSFDPPYVRQEGDMHLHVAEAWRAWWSTERAGDSHGGNHHRPEYYCRHYGDGDALSCQAWQTTHATHRAGVYQVVQVAPGYAERSRDSLSERALLRMTGRGEITALHAEVQARYYSRQDDGKQGELAMRLGIDPLGGTDALSDRVIWGAWRGQTDGTGWDGMSWQPLTVDVVPPAGSPPAGSPPIGGQVTLFVESRCRWPVRNNHAFVDDARMAVAIAGGEGPDPGSRELVDLVREIRDLVVAIEAAIAET